jgi:selenocysteine lyase/cysteine desulfurase
VEQCGIVTFTVAGRDARSIKETLAGQAINVTTSTISSTRFDMEARGLAEVVRASVHYFNDEVEIERFCDVVGSRET